MALYDALQVRDLRRVLLQIDLENLFDYFPKEVFEIDLQHGIVDVMGERADSTEIAAERADDAWIRDIVIRTNLAEANKGDEMILFL